MSFITYEQFEQVDIRVGVIIAVEDFPRAKNPSYKVTVDFGEALGTRRSSAQIAHYDAQALIGQQVIAVINFPPKNIAGFQSECLILGVPTAEGKVALLSPTLPAKLGGKLY